MRKRWNEIPPHRQLQLLKASGAILLAGLFAQLSALIYPGGTIDRWDGDILRWIETLRTPFMNAMMIDVSALGGMALTIVLGTLAALLLAISRDFAGATHLALTSTGGFFIATWLKGIVARPRPDMIPALIKVSGFSYPSGHSITSSAFYTTLAILAYRHFVGRTERLAILGLAATMIALISWSRLYLGVHFPSDTLGGSFVGIAWALLTAVIFAKSHFYGGRVKLRG